MESHDRGPPQFRGQIWLELHKASGLRLLSRRELQLLELAAAGHTDKEASETLGLAPGTINMYWSRIRTKIGHLPRTEMVALLVEDRATEVVADLKKQSKGLSRKLDKSRLERRELLEHLHTLEALIDTAADSILVVDESGDIHLANAAACEMFGHKHMQGMHIRAIVPPRLHGLHAHARHDYLEHPERRLMGESHITAVHRDGSEFSVIATMSGCDTREGQLVTCIFRRAPNA